MFSDVVVLGGRAIAVTDAFFGQPAPWLRAASQDGITAAVAQSLEDVVIVTNSLGQWWRPNVGAFGVQCVALRALGLGQWEVVWMRPPNGGVYARVTLDALLRPVGAIQSLPSPCGPTTQGMLDLTPVGEPIMTDTHRTVQCGPVLICLPTSRGVWTIGQDAFEDRIVAWDAAEQRAYDVWIGKTQVPSHLVLEPGGSPVVCIGGTDLLVHRRDFRPWVPVPPIPPDPPIPPIPPIPPVVRRSATLLVAATRR